MTQTTIQPIRKTITVAAPPDTAFEVFTAQMSGWWNPDYSIGEEVYAGTVLEPREGGRWYESGQQGGECDWGRVLVWEPPTRVVLAWQINGEWKFDPAVTTELEVRFVADGGSATNVELEHRGLDALGPAGAAMHAAFDSPDGWAGLLRRFADSVAA